MDRAYSPRMLTSFLTWDNAVDSDRIATAQHIAAALGPAWKAGDKLRGARKLAAVIHEPTGTEFVAIPGGSFVAGLRPEELELMQTVEYQEETALEWLSQIAEASPPREVTIKPFLISRAPLLVGQARGLGIEDAWVVGDDESEDSAVRYSKDQCEPIMHVLPWRLPTGDEWEYVARDGGKHPFINGATFEEAEDACDALYDMDFDPDDESREINSLGVWGLPWGDWIAEPDARRVPHAGRGGAAMLYPWQGDEIIMQLAGMNDDGCGFDEQCLRFVVDLPAF